MDGRYRLGEVALEDGPDLGRECFDLVTLESSDLAGYVPQSDVDDEVDEHVESAIVRLIPRSDAARFGLAVGLVEVLPSLANVFRRRRVLPCNEPREVAATLGELGVQEVANLLGGSPKGLDVTTTGVGDVFSLRESHPNIFAGTIDTTESMVSIADRSSGLGRAPSAIEAGRPIGALARSRA